MCRYLDKGTSGCFPLFLDVSYYYFLLQRSKFLTIIIYSQFLWEWVYKLQYIDVICNEFILNGAHFFPSLPDSICLHPSCSLLCLCVSVPDFSKKGIVPYLCGSERSQLFSVKCSSSSCQIEESGPGLSLSPLAYFVVAHSACQKVHFISH